MSYVIDTISVSSGLVTALTLSTAESIVEGQWRYDATGTTMVDPGSGKLRGNNATGASVTALAISRITNAGTDRTNLLRSLVAGDTIQIQDQDTAANWLRFTLSASATDNTTWFQLPVTFVSGSGTTPSNNALLIVSFAVGGTGGGGGGTIILSGAGAPTSATGSTGDYYEDTTNGILYGPKTAAGFGTAQTLSISNSAASNTTVFEIGTRVRLTRPGRITGARYSRNAGSASTLYLRVWNDTTGAKLAEVSDTRAGASGDFTVSFPTPVTVGTNEIVIVSIGGASGSDNVPYEAFGTGVATNTTDITWLSWRAVTAVNSFPSGTTSHVGQVEPIYEPDQSWPITVRQTPYFSASVPGMTPASGGGTTNFLRADGTWSPAQPLDATLTALAGANWAANSLAIGSGTDTVAQVTFAINQFPARASTGNLVAKTVTDYALTLLDDTSAAAAQATLGLGTIAVEPTPLHASKGGSGRTSHTVFAPICGGSTATNPQESVASGTSGQVLTHTGPSTMPAWSNPITATSGQVLASGYTITAGSGVFVATGTTFTLPSAGTYQITGQIRGEVIPATTGTHFITAKLRNTTDSTDVVSNVIVVLSSQNGVNVNLTAALSCQVTITASKTIELYVARTGTAFSSSQILTDGNGYTLINWYKIAP